MAIENLLVNVSDLAVSLDFYTTLLGGVVVGEPTPDSALLDFVSATIELRRVGEAVPSTWQEDDQVLGFRHIGFKVAKVDDLVARLRTAEVPFRVEPVDAVGGVRIAFFFAPEGTVLEIVEGALQYHTVVDARAVAKERARGVPQRPRFDHVAVTTHGQGTSYAAYAAVGFNHMGTLLFADDPRGFRIDYLKGGDSVLEVFTFGVGVRSGVVRPDSLGFSAVELGGGDLPPRSSRIGVAGGRSLYRDSNELSFTVGR